MSIFKTKLSAEALRGRIEELRKNESDLRDELSRVRQAHAEALATGGDLSQTKHRIHEITTDLESLPESIRIVEEELDVVERENASAIIQKYQAGTGKTFAQLEAQRLKFFRQITDLVSSIREYDAIFDRLKKSGIEAGVDDLLRYPAADLSRVAWGLMSRSSEFEDWLPRAESESRSELVSAEKYFQRRIDTALQGLRR